MDARDRIGLYEGHYHDLLNDLGRASDLVWTLYMDPAATLWICSAGGGLCSLRGTDLTCYNEKDGLGNQYVQSILEDGAGHLWVGTSGGVYRFDGKRFTNWTKWDARRGAELGKVKGAPLHAGAPALPCSHLLKSLRRDPLNALELADEVVQVVEA
ncbi:MAG: hypothetical protein IPN44_03705 [Flavobacteriales bacterium]|nr:hypothetical protein [Flavobacteriales bacterium]